MALRMALAFRSELTLGNMSPSPIQKIAYRKYRVIKLAELWYQVWPSRRLLGHYTQYTGPPVCKTRLNFCYHRAHIVLRKGTNHTDHQRLQYVRQGERAGAQRLGVMIQGDILTAHLKIQAPHPEQIVMKTI